jgi:hypothetical protein
MASHRLAQCGGGSRRRPWGRHRHRHDGLVVGRIALSACCDGCHRHIPSSGRHQSPTGGFQQPSPVILVRAGAGGRRAVGRVCLCLAPPDLPPAVAATLVLRRLEPGSGTALSQLGVLAPVLQKKLIAITAQHDMALVEGLKRRAVADRDDGGRGQFFLEETIEAGFRDFIE